MQVMVIEHFNGNARAVYQRFRENGRQMPEGLAYVDSWVDTSYERCFQIVECQSMDLLEGWAENWRDLVTFEFFPVISSGKAASAILGGDLDG